MVLDEGFEDVLIQCKVRADAIADAPSLRLTVTVFRVLFPQLSSIMIDLVVLSMEIIRKPIAILARRLMEIDDDFARVN